MVYLFLPADCKLVLCGGGDEVGYQDQVRALIAEFIGKSDLNEPAERVGFEPTVATRATTVFETVPIVHSGTSPACRHPLYSNLKTHTPAGYKSKVVKRSGKWTGGMFGIP